MNAGDLRELLKDVPAEMVVAVYADHGQDCCRANSAGITNVSSIEYSDMEEIHDEDLHHYEDYDKVFEIAS